MSRRVTTTDLLNFNVYESEKVSTARLLELYRAAQWLDFNWEDDLYEPDRKKAQARVEELKKKQIELRQQLKFILDHREHVPRAQEGKNLRKIMAQHHMNKFEAYAFAKEKHIKLNIKEKHAKTNNA